MDPGSPSNSHTCKCLPEVDNPHGCTKLWHKDGEDHPSKLLHWSLKCNQIAKKMARFWWTYPKLDKLINCYCWFFHRINFSPERNLQRQMNPFSLSRYPGSQEQLNDPSVLWQECQHPPLPTRHSLISEEEFICSNQVRRKVSKAKHQITMSNKFICFVPWITLSYCRIPELYLDVTTDNDHNVKCLLWISRKRI